tara:strand:+ start:831 stop:1088 length:258 start_codon:yes stop_codon:yes gene_type:complete
MEERMVHDFWLKDGTGQCKLDFYLVTETGVTAHEEEVSWLTIKPIRKKTQDDEGNWSDEWEEASLDDPEQLETEDFVEQWEQTNW